MLFVFFILNEALSLSFVILNVAQRNEESKKRVANIEAFRCFAIAQHDKKRNVGVVNASLSLSMTKKGL
jgi:hypothetical protein